MNKFYLLMLLMISYYQVATAQTFTSDVTINTSVPSGHGSGYEALWFPNAAAVMPENSSSYSGIYLSANMIRNSSNQWGFANSSLPTWTLNLANGASNEGFTINRSAPSNFSLQTFLKITNAGSMGIGTITPQSLVEIRKDVQNGQGPVLELNNGGSYTGASSEIYMSTYTRDGANPSARIKVADDGDWGGDFYFDTKGTASNAALYTRMYIDGASGNVGLGTTSPVSNLQLMGSFISGGGNANLDARVQTNVTNSLANTGQMLTGWNRSAGGGETDFISNQGAGNVGGFAFYNHDNNNNETQLMWILANGQVLIGNTQGKQSNYMLAVAGTMVATAVTVKTVANWPDFVFKHHYGLPSLTDVKTYIDQNHHLPEIPSAADVEKEGVNLGEMNKLLLKKVEELTLYMIEQNKRIEKLEAQAKSEKK